jgi:hypothetical protein
MSLIKLFFNLTILLLSGSLFAQRYQSEFGLGAYQQGVQRGYQDAEARQRLQINQTQMLREIIYLIEQRCTQLGYRQGTPEFNECSRRMVDVLTAPQGR